MIAGQGEVVLRMLLMVSADRVQFGVRRDTQFIGIVIDGQRLSLNPFRTLFLLVLPMLPGFSGVKLGFGMQSAIEIILLCVQLDQTGSKWTLTLESFRWGDDRSRLMLVVVVVLRRFHNPLSLLLLLLGLFLLVELLFRGSLLLFVQKLSLLLCSVNCLLLHRRLRHGLHLMMMVRVMVTVAAVVRLLRILRLV